MDSQPATAHPHYSYPTHPWALPFHQIPVSAVASTPLTAAATTTTSATATTPVSHDAALIAATSTSPSIPITLFHAYDPQTAAAAALALPQFELSQFFLPQHYQAQRLHYNRQLAHVATVNGIRPPSFKTKDASSSSSSPPSATAHAQVAAAIAASGIGAAAGCSSASSSSVRSSSSSSSSSRSSSSASAAPPTKTIAVSAKTSARAHAAAAAATTKTYAARPAAAAAAGGGGGGGGGGVAGHDSSAGGAGGHGSKLARAGTDKGDRPAGTSENPAIASKDSIAACRESASKSTTATTTTTTTTMSKDDTRRPAARAPVAAPAHPSSVPSTPHQHARDFGYESRDPSPHAAGGHSPRSAYSETNAAAMAAATVAVPVRLGGCQYETSQQTIRRRIPYSIGQERLERIDPAELKAKLTDEEEKALTAGMRELYQRLLPTEQVERNRTLLIEKLERIFNDEWPGNNIRAHLFGSSGNLLCSDDSDVDICITTPWKGMENVCLIAALLARRGMEKVVCISAARVPIVKIWDPELQLACDMNVNNTVALENTRMMRTYVEVDPRVRPLAMIVKHWTRRRVINDAAMGATLSSYTWICMIMAFLQLRQPPVVPALHACTAEKLPRPDGTLSQFGDDLDKLRGFGARNKASLGDLLFQFFRFYAHEYDYAKHVLSIRSGTLLTKMEKGWVYAGNNHLCVEEPFNTERNLANMADEYSFRGLHLEIRRAYDFISAARLDECLEQWHWPTTPEQRTMFVRPSQQPRPALIRSSSQQPSGRGGGGGGGGGGGRGGRGGRNSASHRGGGGGSKAARQAAAAAAAAAAAGQPQQQHPQAIFDNQAAIMYPAQVMAAAAAAGQPVEWSHTGHPLQYSHQDLMTHWGSQNNQENMRAMQFLNQQYGLLVPQMPAMHMQQQQQQHPQQPSPQSHGQGQDASKATSSSASPPRDAAAFAGTARPDLLPFGYPMAWPYYHGMMAAPVSSGHGAAHPGAVAGDFRRTTRPDAGQPAGSALRSQSQPAPRTPTGAGDVTPVASYSGYPSFIPPDSDSEGHDDETPVGRPWHPAASRQGDDGSANHYGLGHSSPNANGHVASSEGVVFGDAAPSRRRRPSAENFPQALLDRRIQKSTSPSSRGSSSPVLCEPPARTMSGYPMVVNGTGQPLPGMMPSPSLSAHSRLPSAYDGEGDAYDEDVANNPLHIHAHHQPPPGHYMGHMAGEHDYAAMYAAMPPPPPPPPPYRGPPVVASSDMARPPAHERPPMVVNGSSINPGALGHDELSFRSRMHYYTTGQAFPPPQDPIAAPLGMEEGVTGEWSMGGSTPMVTAHMGVPMGGGAMAPQMPVPMQPIKTSSQPMHLGQGVPTPTMASMQQQTPTTTATPTPTTTTTTTATAYAVPPMTYAPDQQLDALSPVVERRTPSPTGGGSARRGRVPSARDDTGKPAAPVKAAAAAPMASTSTAPAPTTTAAAKSPPKHPSPAKAAPDNVWQKATSKRAKRQERSDRSGGSGAAGTGAGASGGDQRKGG